jgi:hypothetical protein
MGEQQPLQGHRDLRVYKLAYKLAMETFEASKAFPSEEKYSLTIRSGGLPGAWLPILLRVFVKDNTPK